MHFRDFQMELERDELNCAKAFIAYYRNMAKDLTPPTLKSDQLNCVARFLAATATCELRHRRRKCRAFWSKAASLWTLLHSWHLSDGESRHEAAYSFYAKTEEWDNFMYEQYLRLASYIFGGRWAFSYGGSLWAVAAWYACEWIRETAINGSASILAWEKMLNAAHNNSVWLDKLGKGTILGVLNLGAIANPATIINVSERALRAWSVDEFSEIISPWVNSVSGKQTKVTLPDPGFLVSSSLVDTFMDRISMLSGEELQDFLRRECACDLGHDCEARNEEDEGDGESEPLMDEESPSDKAQPLKRAA